MGKGPASVPTKGEQPERTTGPAVEVPTKISQPGKK